MVERDIYLNRVIAVLDKPVIKVVTGLRRVGKSSLLAMVVAHLRRSGVPEENILQIDMDSLAFESIRTHVDLYRFVGECFEGVGGKKYLFIDEVQEIDSWEKAADSLLAEGAADLTVSGSGARVLSPGPAALLAGRCVEIRVYPLTFGEFLQFRGRDAGADEAVLEDEFHLFLRYGGLPSIHQIGLRDETALDYLSAVLRATFFKDVVSRHAIRDVALLEKLCQYAFDNCGEVTTAKRIADYAKSQRLNLTVDTALNYLSHLQDACIIDRVPRYDVKGKKQLEVYEKYYMGDIGLRQGFSGFSEGGVAGVLENVVYTELSSRGFSILVGKVGGEEVDFIAQRGEEKMYVQVAHLMTTQEAVERAFQPLEKIRDRNPKFVVSMDSEPLVDRGAIRHVNLIEFLLSGG